MFSLSYIKLPKRRQDDNSKWSSQTVKAIVIRRCPKSDGLLFYLPMSKQLISCGDGYKFDTSSPSGPHFGEKFDYNFYMNTRASLETAIHRAPTYQQKDKAFFKDGDKSAVPVHILQVPIDDDLETYTVQNSKNGNIFQALAENIFVTNPDLPILSTTPPLDTHVHWVKGGAKATIILPSTNNEPKQGILQQIDSDWFFYPGHKKKHSPIPLPDFESHYESLINNQKLFKGWVSKSKALTARSVRFTSNVLSALIVKGKVSAKELDSDKVPTLLTHHKLTQNDCDIWDAAYMAEYKGLQSIDTWDLISDEDYQKLKHIYKGLLPTMAITVIKKDGQGNPSRAKYRIVALGNLDHNNWTKQECFAPVLSQMELCLLISIAVKKRCIPKSGDITQAFCQSFLPPDEYYILKPPPGCFLTPPNMYWKLRKTLYGLKQSPCHFYDLACKLLKQLGLKSHPSSPCLFSGVIVPNQPPIYLGLYVDDFIYFSESPKVERIFKERFSKLISIDWNGEIDYFLGICFKCTRHKDNNVTIKLQQTAFIDHLLKLANLEGDNVNPVTTPYQDGFPIDSIPKLKPSPNQAKLTKYYQQLIGSINWLSISTCPDISTVTNLLAKYMLNPNSHHIAAAKRVIRYLKGTQERGIMYTSQKVSTLSSFIIFPTNIDPTVITSMSDAKWGPQDQSRPDPKSPSKVDVFKTRSLSGFVIWLNGPVHWISKRQTITARSTAESKIYATDECIKALLHVNHLISGLHLSKELMPKPTVVYNDNTVCVAWSKSTTTKGLRHMQIRENAVRECVQSSFADIQHVEGKTNLADLFTKEDKDDSHFIILRDLLLSP